MRYDVWSQSIISHALGKWAREGIALIAVVAALIAAPTGAVAQEAGVNCSGRQIVARGEPARYRWLAMLKARGNWRSEVRVLPDLGAAYAGYGIAQNVTERCIFNGGSVTCTITATPCRR